MKKSLIIFALFLSQSMFSQGTQLLRQPSISKTEVVFIYANDLWKAPLNGGTAIRLTSGEGYESNPHFSKDGKTIAFTAEYDGNSDVYIMPSEGGEPQRLTFHPDGDYVEGWTTDNKILFRSGREGKPTASTKLYTIGIEDSFPEALDLQRAAYGDISADGKYIAYTPITSWDPEWRNYRGGQAMPIWIVDMETKDLITTPQLDKERHLDPKWLNGVVYYLSERDYTSNIWSFDPKTKTEKQITFHKKFDVKSLSANQNQIVYEQGGYLHLLNVETLDTKQLNITATGDLNFARPRWEDVSANRLSNPQISPKGMRAVFEYRGDIFTVPKEHGSWRNLTNSSGVADRSPVWSPKGDKIAWFSDASGNYKMVVADQDGNNQEEITLPNATFFFKPEWSNDGQYIAYTDTGYNIWVLNLETKKAVKADTDRYAHPDRSMNPVWSPDSKWIAYAKQMESHFKAIFVYNVETNEKIQITDGMADAITPIWDATGKYIFTLASTNYGLTSGWLDMSSYDVNVTRGLYAIVLNSKDDAPILPKTDEENSKKKDDKTEAKKGDNKKDDSKDKDIVAEVVKIVIDKENIFNRIVPLQLKQANYVGLIKGPQNIVFVAETVPNEEGQKIHSYSLEDGKATDYAKNISEMVVSADRESTLIRQNNNWSIVATSKPPKDDEKLKMDLKIKVDPKEEYHQMYKEGWRYMRDFLYVNNVHGAPWDAVYEWYAPWIDHVRHRTDLNYVIDIMSGEVSIGHSYVSGGDMPKIDRVPVGLLGCDFEWTTDGYRISKIYTGETWNPDTYSPLGLPGIHVKVGDYIISINGKTVSPNENIYSLLEQTANRETTIEVNSKPNKTGAKSFLVKPVANERNLRYLDWVEGNRKKVDELSNGKLAYVYVPNTSQGGFESFNRYYFSQQDKKGVIIDERNNGGGSAADYMIDIMSRELFGYFNSKTNDNRPWTTPMAGIWGPKVMLINERAGSGGDLLPYMFKAKNIGPLIGTRTWGGLVGTWDTPPFIDGGRMVAPRGGFYDVNGEWAVEGEGVAPDIEVIQEPKLTMNGRDPQLERGVKEALKLLETQEFKMQPEPAAPVRWKRPAGYEKEN
ncbi:S41 family peptidase [Gelidibacter sp.]|uniref:S41 family peptidase n=1 Tax=Gelidibacter sp. TaxID=2018083 RepID=UPI002C3A2FD8|nr:PDZ domain-containing protein [Gelidibacter sp.]HUH28810.1 PDZ domain-containing protein [Gelidibacter sp.]